MRKERRKNQSLTWPPGQKGDKMFLRLETIPIVDGVLNYDLDQDHKKLFYDVGDEDVVL
jgi:hypothetical protein